MVNPIQTTPIAVPVTEDTAPPAIDQEQLEAQKQADKLLEDQKIKEEHTLKKVSRLEKVSSLLEALINTIRLNNKANTNESRQDLLKTIKDNRKKLEESFGSLDEAEYADMLNNRVSINLPKSNGTPLRK